MPLTMASMAGYVALSGKPVNVADAYDLPPGSPSISRAFDQRSGYRTKSCSSVPMKDHRIWWSAWSSASTRSAIQKPVLKPVALVEEAVIPFNSVD